LDRERVWWDDPVRRYRSMDRPARYLTTEEMAALQTADDEQPQDQLVADAADDVSAGRALGEVATLDPLAGAEVEDELLEEALGELPGLHDPDLSGPDEDDVEAWLDEGAAG
jgi:hypothetical protein